MESKATMKFEFSRSGRPWQVARRLPRLQVHLWDRDTWKGSGSIDSTMLYRSSTVSTLPERPESEQATQNVEEKKKKKKENFGQNFFSTVSASQSYFSFLFQIEDSKILFCLSGKATYSTVCTPLCIPDHAISIDPIWISHKNAYTVYDIRRFGRMGLAHALCKGSVGEQILNRNSAQI